MVIYLIILAVSALVLRPAYELLSRVPVLGDFLVLAMGLFIGYCLCKMSDTDFGLWKMIFMACLFIALVGWLGIFGFIIIIVIAIVW